ncbi:SHOCT domain-containing protein [Cryptosporangium minutisporangium]|uniref:SHOCT domain-containing protein n=1 Tax=Cryptosporangium minutisporangium TaxID=113569 RepID=A0ABP6SS11_9ACTN
MPGLLRGIARTAVVAGTATTVSNRVSRRQAGRWSQQAAAQQPAPQQQYAQPQQQPYYAPPPPPQPAPQPTPPPDAMSAKLEQLKQLGELKAQGVLTDAEVEQQKARILAS